MTVTNWIFLCLTLSTRLCPLEFFSRCPAMKLQTDETQYFIAYVTNMKEVFLIVAIRF